MIGHDQGGISEALEFIINKYPDEIQQKLSNNVFVTGSMARCPGFQERLESDLRQVRPFKSSLKVTKAKNPDIDAWKGAAKLTKHSSHSSLFHTKQEYDENGSHYFAEHSCGNIRTKKV